MTDYYALTLATPPDGTPEIFVVPQRTGHADTEGELQFYQKMFAEPGDVELQLADSRKHSVPETAQRRSPIEIRKVCGHAAPRELEREGEQGRVRCVMDPDHEPELPHRDSIAETDEGQPVYERAWHSDGTVETR